MFAAAGEIKNE